MQIIPKDTHLLDTNESHLHKFSAQASKSTQHGSSLHDPVKTHRGENGPSRLLALPSESLTHISAFLDPVSLFAFGRTSKILHEHVDDDNTWHSAFACQFLGERPEMVDVQQNLLMHRSEDSWKREFVARYNMSRRWERCRNGTVSHIPHYSPVSAMHLLSDRSYGPALLSVSLQYGIVARSFPLSGKVVKGFLSASDGFGLGNGNPNAEFIPNVSSCAVASEGWTVHVVFGFANGEVALASAMRVMEVGRAATRVLRCRVDDQHRGPVVDAVWDGPAFVTAGADGEVRIWDAKRMCCTWMLKDRQDSTSDACVHVLANLDHGVILATKKSGTSVVWTGLHTSDNDQESIPVYPLCRIPSQSVGSEKAEPSRVFFDRSMSRDTLSYGIHFLSEMQFYRVNVDLVSGQFEVIRFNDGPLAPIQAIYPFFPSSEEGGKSVVFVGDTLGRVSLFNWSATPRTNHEEVSSFHRLDSFSDGQGVSAIACNAYVLVVGSTRGVTRVYDTLTLRLLREFSSPIPRPNTSSTAVKDIIVDKNLLLVAVGERIMAWEAKAVRPNKPLASLKKSSAKIRNAKWHKRFELAQDVTESRKAVDDVHASERRSHERRRIHQAALSGLGLDENEALQYILMLSRDEHVQQAEAQQDDGVFETDFDDIPFVPSISRSSSCSHFEEDRVSDISSPLTPTTELQTTSRRAQITPPPRPEPIQASGHPSSSLLDVGASEGASSPLSLEDAGHFPALSSSTSSTPSRHSPASGPSSWSDRLKATLPSSASGTTTTSPFSHVPSSNIPVRRSVSGPSSASPSLLSETLRLHRQAESGGGLSAGPAQAPADEEEEMDADLKLALELSLAEAMSRGQN